MSEHAKGTPTERWDAIEGIKTAEENTMTSPDRDSEGRSMGQRFIDLREQTGMSRTEFSEYLNIPYRTMQEWELGRRTMPEYVFSLIEFKVQTQFGLTPEETRHRDPNALGNQMRGIEDMVEQNDNSFDGIINNLPRQEENITREITDEQKRESVLKKLKDCVKILEEEKDRHPHLPVPCCDAERT